MPREEDLDDEEELLTVEEDLSEDELLTEEPELLLLLSWELLDTLELLRRLLSWEPLDTEEAELLVEEELVPRVEDEPELLVEVEPVLLVEEELLDEDLVWEEVVLLLDPEERLSCEYESTGDASMASATADASAMFRMFFMMIRC